jgi:hypothetical protein
MQNEQEINWLAILLPSLVVALSAIIVQILLAFWLSKVTENYKKDLNEDLGKKIEDYKGQISKELENHKMQLQSDFQTEFYEFQTKFSVFHQKKAEVIERLFELLADVFNNAQIIANWQTKIDAEKITGIQSLPSEKEFLLKSINSLEEFGDYFDKKRLYLDAALQKKILVMYRLLLNMFDEFSFSDKFQLSLQNLLNLNILPLMNELEKDFKSLIISAPDSRQIKKRNE